MRRFFIFVVFFLMFFSAVGSEKLSGQDFFAEPASGEELFLTPRAVQESIDGAVEYLRKAQNENGSWDGYPSYEPGTSALVLLALLAAGLPKDDPTMVRGLEYLRMFPQSPQQCQTYPISLQTMVFCQADPERDRLYIERNVQWLISSQFRTNNAFQGGWSYTGEVPQSSRTDNSNSQFATLALYEAQRAGMIIAPEVWQLTEDYWARMQNDDGSWGYRASPGPETATGSGGGTGSMTCAGIAALAIVESFHSPDGARIKGEKIDCCLPVDSGQSDRIDRGLQWLAKHFSVQSNPGTAVGTDTYLFYYLYGLERAARLTSNRFIGSNDWYREGADYLLRRKGELLSYWKAGPDLQRLSVISTSFALLFLSKGRWPVLISKLKYVAAEASPTAPWNRHPDDLTRLTEYAEQQWKRNMIWQVIDSANAVADDYLQTPVLYLCGQVSPLPKENEAKKRFTAEIREYLEQGGFILAEALDGDESFETGFRDLMRAVFPDEPEGGLALLPPEHPIWNLEKEIPPEKLRPILGVDFGCRTSVIFIPPFRAKAEDGQAPSVEEDRPSLSCLWALAGNVYRKSNYAPKVQAEIQAGLDLGLNILAYATGRDLKYKEEIPEKTNTSDVPKTGGLYAAILLCGGGSACAPRAIPNLMKAIASEIGVPVETSVAKIRASAADLYRYPLLFLHGRTAFRFSESERRNLRQYFERGGFLFANSICASQPFNDSFRTEMKKIFPDAELRPIPPDDPIFSNRYGGYAIKSLDLRKPQRLEGRRIRSSLASAPPELLGIQHQGRWVVVFSPYDVSCALEKSGSVECAGYTAESAFKLSVNIVLYAVEFL